MRTFNYNHYNRAISKCCTVHTYFEDVACQTCTEDTYICCDFSKFLFHSTYFTKI